MLNYQKSIRAYSAAFSGLAEYALIELIQRDWSLFSGIRAYSAEIGAYSARSTMLNTLYCQKDWSAEYAPSLFSERAYSAKRDPIQRDLQHLTLKKTQFGRAYSAKRRAYSASRAYSALNTLYSEG